MTVQQRLVELGIDLPKAPEAVGSYVPAVRTGSLVFTAGQLPFSEGELLATGKVGREISLDVARQAARRSVLNALAVVKAEIGSLETVSRIVRLNVFVNSAPAFTDQAKVANGAGDLLVEIFGPAGRHTRCAIGVSELPLDAPVELDLIVEVCEPARQG